MIVFTELLGPPVVLHDKRCLQNVIGLHLSQQPNWIVIAGFQPIEGSQSEILILNMPK